MKNRYIVSYDISDAKRLMTDGARAPARAWATCRIPNSPTISPSRATSTWASPGRHFDLHGLHRRRFDGADCRYHVRVGARRLRVVGSAAARRRAGSATHWFLRESAVWRDRNTEEVRSAQRDAEYAYRLAVEPAPAKELRLFGLVSWTIERFILRRTPPPCAAVTKRRACAKNRWCGACCWCSPPT